MALMTIVRGEDTIQFNEIPAKLLFLKNIVNQNYIHILERRRFPHGNIMQTMKCEFLPPLHNKEDFSMICEVIFKLFMFN